MIKRSYVEWVAMGHCPSCHMQLGPQDQYKLCTYCRETNKRRALKRSKNGRCRHCTRLATEGGACSVCATASRVRSKERQRALRAAKLCQRCMAPAVKSHCDACAIKRSKLHKRRHQQLRAADRCSNCGAQAVPERSLCPKCAEQTAVRDAQRHADPVRRAQQRARFLARKAARLIAGLCFECGKTRDLAHKRCEKCRERGRIRSRIASLQQRTKRLAAADLPNPSLTRRDPAGARRVEKTKQRRA